MEPQVIWLTGLSGAGKSTIAKIFAERIRRRGHKVEELDGDQIREVFPQTGFSPEDRDQHIRRVGFLASRLESHGVFVIVTLISPYRTSRDFVRRLCRKFVEVHVATPLEVCEQRDPKGLYQKARKGELKEMTGIDAPYEAPLNPEITLNTVNCSPEECVDLLDQHIFGKSRQPNSQPLFPVVY